MRVHQAPVPTAVLVGVSCTNAIHAVKLASRCERFRSSSIIIES